MSRRPAPKRIHYVRARYNQNAAPQQSLELLVRQAIQALGSVQATQIQMGLLGTVAIRQRTLGSPVMLAIGAGAPNEHMSTMGLDVVAVQDADHLEAPPPRRAFKHAEAFVLLEERDLLVIVDGSFNIDTVAAYLRELIQLVSPAGQAVSVFELKPVSNRERADVLAREGIKELHIDSSLYAATQLMADAEASPTSAWKNFTGTLRSFIEEEQNEAEAQMLAEDWGALEVTTVIKAKRGSYAKEPVLDSVEALGKGLLEDVPDDVKLTIVTRDNTRITPEELVRVKSASLRRRENSNDLDVTEVWEKLAEYREQLQNTGEWLR